MSDGCEKVCIAWLYNIGGMVEMLDSSDSGGIMESVESNNFYRLGTTLTNGHLTKLHLAVSQSLLAQEDIA